MSKDDDLNKIGAAFSYHATLLDQVVTMMEESPKRDDSVLIDQIGTYLCHGSPCSYHKKEAQNVINMIKKHYNITL